MFGPKVKIKKKLRSYICFFWLGTVEISLLNGKIGNFQAELKRVNKQSKAFYATNMCKKRTVFTHISARNEVFVFLLHFPGVRSLVEIS